MSPAKIAIAVAVTIAAMAGIGAMKKVTGTSNAVAIVAVRPGTAPTNRPNSDAASITTMLYGSNTSAKACAQAALMAGRPPPRNGRLPCDPLQYTPRQRNLQHLVERVMDDHRHRQRERHDPFHAHAENGEQRTQVDDTGEDEAEPVDEHYVEGVDAEHRGERN